MIDIDTLQKGNLILVNNRVFMVTGFLLYNNPRLINGMFQDGKDPKVGDYPESECEPITFNDDSVSRIDGLIEVVKNVMNLFGISNLHELQNYLKLKSFI